MKMKKAKFFAINFMMLLLNYQNYQLQLSMMFLSILFILNLYIYKYEYI
jgi:hypothetical protein